MTYTPRPLEYSQPIRRQRPAIVTAIGVISMIVGWCGAVSYGVILVMSTMPPAAFAPRPPRTATIPAAPPTATPATVTTGTVNATPITPFTNMSRAAFVLATLCSLFGLLLAIGLMALATMVLRNSQWAVEKHWWYVWTKIPLVIFASAASLSMTWSMIQGMNTMMAATPVRGGAPPPQMSDAAMFRIATISTVLSAAVSLVYPVGLIFALRSRAVRDYTSAVRE